MIPKLPRDQACATLLTDLFVDLQQDGFSGKLTTSETARVLASNDNSIWEQIPIAIISPQTTTDVSLLLKLLATPEYQSIKITPRGGGTSTAGQSITQSVSLDCKRFLNQIKEIDVEAKQVTVECGVVLETLGRELAKHGLMLGPTVATADRATIGGMIGNDSAGKGSLVYGKMSDCVISLRTVLRGGEVWDSTVINPDELDRLEKLTGVVGDIHCEVRRACEAARPLLERHWPDLPRFVSGYNLPMGWDGNTFNLNRILCGSEGTLGVIIEATLQCVDIPKDQRLLVVGFTSFDGALRFGASIKPFKPLAIEVVDEFILQAAKNDIPSCIDQASSGVLCIACQDGKELLEATKATDGVLSATLLETAEEIEEIWGFRNRSVGLLSSSGTTKRPVPFVEDCAVPPERLADFIRDFQSLLEKHKLCAGMFGHVDAGVIHVRPALDLCDEHDKTLIRTVTDEVASLVQSYGGVLWGEHGKGFRSEYGPQVFGDAIWRQICRIKAVFDPTNQFNPGKVAGPTEHHPLISLDSATRGEVNSEAARLPILSEVLRCDGNSQCQTVKTDEAMCPTYRLHDDPMHSPRGRAELLRHWLHRIGNRKVTQTSSMLTRLLHCFTKDDFSHDVYEALHGCIGCKSCASDCPMEIDIPHMRSEFLSYYYKRYPRPLRDLVWSNMEGLLPFKATAVGRIFTPNWVAPIFGIVDPPKMSHKLNIKTSCVEEILKNPPDVIHLQDSFTTHFRSDVVLSLLKIAESLGLTMAVLPLKPCGKALHVRGKLRAFRSIAQSNIRWLEQLRATNIPIVGIDPAATLLWREEYPQILNQEPLKVLLTQEWLFDQDLAKLHLHGSWRLFPHCIEHAVVKESETHWQKIFERVGADLEIVNTSCCGMGGLFGHEKEHKQQSIDIWQQSWARHEPKSSNSLTTGYSCYNQANRIESLSMRHPLEVLAKFN